MNIGTGVQTLLGGGYKYRHTHKLTRMRAHTHTHKTRRAPRPNLIFLNKGRTYLLTYLLTELSPY
jgi:hypothetical protein